jgi:hypothetical protein
LICIHTAMYKGCFTDVIRSSELVTYDLQVNINPTLLL